MKRKQIPRKHARPLARLLPALWLLLTVACCTQTKNDPLPKATQQGLNTFGCKINGKAWIPNGGTGFQAPKPITGGFYQIDTYPVYRRGVSIRAVSKDGQEVQIYLDGFKAGDYLLNTDTPIQPYSLNPKNYGLYRDSGGETYITSRMFTGRVVITKSDTTTGVVAGTFEFVAGNSKGNKVSITNGRFDVNYRTQ